LKAIVGILDLRDKAASPVLGKTTEEANFDFRLSGLQWGLQMGEGSVNERRPRRRSSVVEWVVRRG
jgi:hypothetical protein